MNGIVEFIAARIDDDERDVAPLKQWAKLGYDGTDGRLTSGLVAVMSARRALAEVRAKRLLLDEHLPQWRTVEWDHDQNGKGEALCCPRCQNAEHSEWNPPSGQATGLPEGFVTPYVLAPCRTLRALALPFADRPDYDERWKP